MKEALPSLLCRIGGRDRRKRRRRIILHIPHLALYRQCCIALEEAKIGFRSFSSLMMILLPIKEEQALRQLKRHTAVGMVEMDRPVQTKLPKQGEGIQPDPTWNLKAIGAYHLPIPRLSSHPKIGVIDTGISPHRALSVVRRLGHNFINPRGNSGDQNGHGTHVAGIIGARIGWRHSSGVARGFPLIPLKAFNEEGLAFTSDIIASIEYAIQNRFKILNMSFGLERPQAAMQQAIRSAHQAGIIMVTAAGNGGQQRVDYPARYGQTITVTACNKERRIASFSNYGSQVDLTAPGVEILSTWLHNRYQVLSGTSMAAAHVTGVVALLCARYPRLSPNDARQILRRTALPLPDESPLKQGAGIVQAKRALHYLEQLL